MKIFINNDTFKEISIKTKDELLKLAKKHDLIIVDTPDDADFIYSIGGDGTFLESASIAHDKPIIGINCGRLGYLTDINPEDMEKSLMDIKNNNYHIENRMMLEGFVISKDKTTKINPALNEIALIKNVFGVIGFDVYINSRLINSYTADGIIVSTPTGSTAYNLSCGGPIVEPTADIITITPIAAHTVIDRSIIISDQSEVMIKIRELRESDCYILYDGNPIKITIDDVVKIRKSRQSTKIVKFKEQSYIDTIREKIH